MSTTYVAKFKYEGGKSTDYSPAYKNALEEVYVWFYDQFCELTNPHFEEWNSEYSRPNDGFDGDVINPDSQYNRYIQAKEMEIVEQVLNPLLDKSVSIKRFFIGEECDLRMEMHDGTVMQMFVEPA